MLSILINLFKQQEKKDYISQLDFNILNHMTSFLKTADIVSLIKATKQMSNLKSLINQRVIGFPTDIKQLPEEIKTNYTKVVNTFPNNALEIFRPNIFNLEKVDETKPISNYPIQYNVNKHTIFYRVKTKAFNLTYQIKCFKEKCTDMLNIEIYNEAEQSDLIELRRIEILTRTPFNTKLTQKLNSDILKTYKQNIRSIDYIKNTLSKFLNKNYFNINLCLHYIDQDELQPTIGLGIIKKVIQNRLQRDTVSLLNNEEQNNNSQIDLKHY